MQTSTLALSFACCTSFARSHVNLRIFCGITADFHWIINAHCYWTAVLLTGLLHSGWTEMSAVFFLKKLRKLHSSLAFQFISEYCACVKLKTESTGSVARILLLPTALLFPQRRRSIGFDAAASATALEFHLLILGYILIRSDWGQVPVRSPLSEK